MLHLPVIMGGVELIISKLLGLSFVAKEPGPGETWHPSVQKFALQDGEKVIGTFFGRGCFGRGTPPRNGFQGLRRLVCAPLDLIYWGCQIVDGFIDVQTCEERIDGCFWAFA